MEIKLVREFSEDHRECSYCSQPIMVGEVSYRESQTNTIGCCPEHVIDSVRHAEDVAESCEFRVVFEGNDLNTAVQSAK